MNHFTVKEAEALIPELERIYAAIAEIVARAEAKSALIRRMEAEKAGVADMAIESSQLKFLAGSIDGWLQKVRALGAEPKGLSPALVDIPHRLAGRDVYLCWKLGDKKIRHYHGVDEGFAGRKPLP